MSTDWLLALCSPIWRSQFRIHPLILNTDLNKSIHHFQTYANNQSFDVWFAAFLSLCSWHAKQAVLEYLGKHNQSPFLATHPLLDYNDKNWERGWDADFLDTTWVALLNKKAEEDFYKKVTNHAPQGLTTEKLQEQILEHGKRKQICLLDKEL